MEPSRHLLRILIPLLALHALGTRSGCQEPSGPATAPGHGLGSQETSQAELAPQSGWTIHGGLARTPELPAAMLGVRERLFLFTAKRLEVFDTRSELWSEQPIELPESLGAGLALATDHQASLYWISGGGRRTAWKLSLEDGSITPLPGLQVPIEEGAALSYWKGSLYLNSGGLQDDFWLLRPGAKAWERHGRIGGESPMHTQFGRHSGFLAATGDAVYAWPDHHIHRMDTDSLTWKPGNWVAINCLPTTDGGGVAAHPHLSSLFVLCGFGSRSLNEVDIAGQKAYFLRPRLPFVSSGSGDRLALALQDDKPTLFVYAAAPENKLCSIRVQDLQRVDARDDRADNHSPWRRFHTPGGSNGVRSWKLRRWSQLPGPMDDQLRATGTLGVMGSLGDELFTMRRAFSRRLDPYTGLISYFPGVNLGRFLALGAAGIHDGERSLYMITGRSDYFIRRVLDDVPYQLKQNKGALPIDQTHLEVLAPLPHAVGRGASLAHVEGAVYALRGGATRDFFRYSVELNSWESLAPLPAEALAPGEHGAGLVAAAGELFVVTGTEVWRYSPRDSSWACVGELGFRMQWDGGMLACDGTRYAYVAQGQGTDQMGRFDLQSGVYQALLSAPPDVISGEGNRLALLEVEGQPRLYLNRGHNTNEVLWVPIAELQFAPAQK